MKKYILSMFLLYIFIPITVFAYSDYIIASGKNIGIELNTNNPIIIGSYDIDDYNPLRNSNLKIGDKIKKINNISITSSYQLQEVLNKVNKDSVTLTYIRDNKEYQENIELKKIDGQYRSGLYIKDHLKGVATLTYIDSYNMTFGGVGHTIIDSATKNRFAMDNGYIYESIVTGINKSYNGHPGEKNARSNSNNILGKVIENTDSGIFGQYTADIPKEKLYKVATSDEIELGNAKILTTIDNDNVQEFDIKILKINPQSKTKNILFEITDKYLLEKTGGIIQGMSGSPIIQNNNIIGAINYVLVDKTNKGYGIFITNMLEEAEN